MADPLRRTPVGGPRRTPLDARPPRYRLLRAASRLPHREPERLSVSFERLCPACDDLVLVTQVDGPDGPEFHDDHACPAEP